MDTFTIYNYATRRTDISTEDKAAFIKKFKNQAKKGRKAVKFMVRRQDGRTEYWVAIQ